MDTQAASWAGDSGRLAGQSAEPGAAPELRTIVIVGAGFSGTAVALNLLRLPHARPLRVVLIERARARMMRGAAYASESHLHLLNVPAGRMSASSLDPLEFLAFAQRTLPRATAADFLPRRLYGDYLESTLLTAAQAAPPHVRLERLRGDVIGVERPHRTRCIPVHLEDGTAIAADAVVLALGNPPPATLPGGERLRGTGRYVADPWQMPRLRAGETLLIAGTSLTMADVALAADQAAKGRVVIHAISRHGLTPAVQSDFQQGRRELHGGLLLRAAWVSVRRLVRSVRTLAAEVERDGGDWREVITLVRALAPELWQRLSTREKRRFLRHVRCYWDIHRHRLPESAGSALEALRKERRLEVHAGRLLELKPAGRKVVVTWRARGESAPRALLVDRVINCTGPDYDARRTHDRLLRSLIAQAIAVPDPLGLGLVTDGFGALVDASGRAAGNICCIGPMLRPRYWEATAVQELRTHAERLARHLTARTTASRQLNAAERASPVLQRLTL
jgi:uncharacterized NAD(P)/FAD-binding protein YdhS